MAAIETPNSWPGKLKLFSALLLVAAVLILARALPFDALVESLQEWIQSLGMWGPLAFVGLYAVWAVLFIPGAALTLVGGAVFGLGTGTAAALAGATAGAALSFLIARYFARERVEKFARSHRNFAAIDRAIEKGGWKIVALLRLSPAMPFNVQNYLYGVTAIRFWPCVLTSMVFMLPGTFLYVYLGRLAGQGLAAASGGGEKPLAQWALLGVGLLATVAVTVYVTRLSKKALNESAELSGEEDAEEQPKRRASPAGAIALFSFAALAMAGALWAHAEKESLQRLFGPPRVEMREAYAAKPDGPVMDHAAYTALLEQHVDADGFVDYEGLKTEQAMLQAYIGDIGRAPFDAMGRDEKLALLINAYNAFTLQLILDNYPIDSIRSIPEAERWKAERWNVGGRTYSLDQIEHEEIRPKFAEPRIHFALVCAAVGCPPLRREAYTGARLDEQLEDQARYVHSHDRWLRYEPGSDRIELTALYDWYGGDFKQTEGSVLKFAARYVSDLEKALRSGAELKTRFLEYDWSLNEQQ